MHKVILVDDDDREQGQMEALQAHKEGALHRAFSVYIVNDKGDFLLTQRALNKPHSGGKWGNACCAHPQPGQNTLEAASNRLFNNLAIKTKLDNVYHFGYRVVFDNGLIEHELDHVYTGRFSGTPIPDPDEVVAWKYVNPDFLIEDVKANPDNYMQSFKLSYEIVLMHTAIID